jgi:Fe2+ transport system protein FeoA
MRCLAELRPGEEGVVTDLRGDDALRVRLMEMGLLRGERVRVLKYAPLGDPLELLVGGYHLSLRRQDARHVLVRDRADERADVL